MKKIVLSLSMILLVLTLMGCPPVTTQPSSLDTTPMTEAFFSLPEGVSIVSESFDLTLSELSYPGFPSMGLNATYILQNDGEDTSTNILIPYFPSTLNEANATNLSLYVKVNFLQESLDWTFSSTPELFTDYENLTYEAFHDAIDFEEVDLTTIPVHSYLFYAPLSGQPEALDITVPEGTFIIADWYIMDKVDEYGYRNVQDKIFSYRYGDIYIPAFPYETYGSFVTFGNEATFLSNYDFRGDHQEMTFLDYANQNSLSDYQAQYLYYLTQQAQEEGDLFYFFPYIYGEFYNESLLFNMFTKDISLPGNGAQTTITVHLPSIPWGTAVEGDTRFLFYDLYLDTERYINQEIPVTFTLTTTISISTDSTYDFSSPLTITNFTNGTRIRIVASIPFETT